MSIAGQIVQRSWSYQTVRENIKKKTTVSDSAHTVHEKDYLTIIQAFSLYIIHKVTRKELLKD